MILDSDYVALCEMITSVINNQSLQVSCQLIFMSYELGLKSIGKKIRIMIMTLWLLEYVGLEALVLIPELNSGRDDSVRVNHS